MKESAPSAGKRENQTHDYQRDRPAKNPQAHRGMGAQMPQSNDDQWHQEYVALNYHEAQERLAQADNRIFRIVVNPLSNQRWMVSMLAGKAYRSL